MLCFRKLKKVSNLFLISLAVADLVVSCLVMPFAVANDIFGYWPFSHHFCNIWLSFDVLSATASILNLCAISLDRYIHMKTPFVYERTMTTRKCLGFIATIWLASILISFLPINLELHKHRPTDNFNNLTEQLSGQRNSNLTLMSEGASSASNTSNPHGMCSMDLNAIYSVTSSSISFYIPCIVMVTIYVKMYRLARFHAQSILKSQSFNIANGGKHKQPENKALYTLGMIMGLFLLSWIPFFIVNLVSSFCVDCVPAKLFVAFTWLGYFNSTMNPIIYSKFNADFRTAFKRILCCQRCRTKDPYDFKPRSRTSSNVATKKLSYNSAITNNKNGIAKLQRNGHSNNNKLEENDVMETQSFIEKEDLVEKDIELSDLLKSTVEDV